LYRQLILFITALLVVLFVSSFVISVRNVQSFLQEQLLSHAQDTATSLGLSMTTAAAENDVATLNSMADVIFDRGYYHHIVFADLEQRPIIERHMSLALEGVPSWFVRIIPLETPPASSEIMSGWRRVGVLTVVSHPGFAYRELWRVAQDNFVLFGSVSLVAYLLIGFGLHLLLRPLDAVEKQADAICQRNFVQQPFLPKTRELRRVVEAMNRMAGKLKIMFTEQVELTEQMRAQSHRDPVTGLSNRRDFDDRMAAYLASEEVSKEGALMIVQLSGIGRFNQEHGREAGDDLMRQVGEKIKQALQLIPNVLLARRTGADFTAFLPAVNEAKARKVLEQCFQDVIGMQVFAQEARSNMVHLGMSYTTQRREVAELLADADMALRRAQGKGPNGLEYSVLSTEDDADEIKSAGDWLNLFKGILADKQLTLHYQPAFSCPDKQVMHYEVLARVKAGYKLIPAGVFLPMAERYDLLADFDRLIVETTCQFTKQQLITGPRFCVNLSARSVQNAEFVGWLEQYLQSEVEFAGRLILEVQEYCVQLAEAKLRDLIERLEPLGVKFSIDHFGVGASAFSYLQSLRVHYLKVSNSFVRNIAENSDNKFFIKSVLQIARGQDIKLFAEGVETEAEWNALSDLGIDGALGYYLCKPQQNLPV